MKYSLQTFFIAIVSAFFSVLSAHAQDTRPVYVGFDGAYGVKNSTSAQAIELGLKAAIHEINAAGGVLNGRPIELLVKDNRSVPARGIANLEDFAATQDLIAMFGGRFSPVLLQQLERTHELKLPLLDVWAAADGITNHTYTPNYSFRLSLKDSWAMPAMRVQAHAKGGDKIGLLLPNTGWGRSNQKALGKELEVHPETTLVGTVWYNWGEQDMLQHYQALIDSGAQAILLVANDLEGSVLVRQLGAQPNVARVPIISHWGVTGGNMVETSGPALLDLDFTIVQTFSFATAMPNARKVFEKTVADMAGVKDVEKLESPVGVGHAYDMMHILAKAVDAAGTTDRAAIRHALENLGAHDGLVRNYERPFSDTNHDALSPDLVFFAKYLEDGTLVPATR
ncbi:ABC transporter substrate-binding protein [Magnetovibrio sp.]|uniref:ABC transporter substrate-binding protein n=1 Tax=Magnetovibrio sp. TaxID=2024836 RepID=UPI002F9338EC